jgi:hypothetical protein
MANKFNVGDKVKHVDGSSVNIAPPSPVAASAIPKPSSTVTAHVTAYYVSRPYFVNGANVFVDLVDVTYDNTNLTSTQVVSGLSATS